MTNATTHSPDVPMPAGAVEVYGWTDDNKPLGVPTDQTNPNASRYFTGSSWTVDRGSWPSPRGCDIRVFIDGLQHTDGRIERNIVVNDDEFTIAEARRFAAL
jgi:hypothetical protein